jgi:WS/DGAT/MGAT family acyltransferase
MRQLSGIDSLFLFQETPAQPMHVGMLSIFDPSTAPGGIVRFKRVIQTMHDRAHLAPYLRERVFEVPFNADFPYWVRDHSFDPEFHIRHIALPKPGDWRQLCIQVARLYARPLDRSRPLWELYVIEGLDNVKGFPRGSFATLTKTHHAAIDGKSVADIGTALCDPTPEIRDVPGSEEWQPDPVPTAAELAILAFQNNALKPLRYMEFMQKALAGWSGSLQALADRALDIQRPVPRTRFNGTVSAHRVFEGVDYSLDEIRDVKNEAGGTVNDVVLAICAGALRRYLEANDELPRRSLVSMCPISVRDPNATARGGNEVTAMAVPLHTNVADAAGRLAAIITETRDAKELTNAIGAKTMVEMANFMPTQVAALGARVAAEQGLANHVQPIFNTVITNVPGSPTPIYSNGAKLLNSFGLGLSADGNGLFHAVTSYAGRLTISITCCRDMMPDPATYATYLRESFDELKAAYAEDEPAKLSA